MSKKNQFDLNLIERFNPTIEQGLSNEQVLSRKELGAVNNVEKKYSKSYFSIFFGNIFTFFNLLGLIVCIALISISAPISRFFFVAIYLANMAIGILQEIRAKLCIDRLTLVAGKPITCIRDGFVTEIPSKEIVLDDVLKLGLGNQIPTDCIILDGDVEVNESLLTGESVPVKKKKGDELFAGSFIVAGVCTAQAVKVGKENYVEKLSAKAKQYKKPYSELMHSLNLIIKVIGCIIIPLAVAFLIKAIVINDTGLTDAINGTSTVIIGMIPSGMFLLTSTALAVGVIKLARQNTLVQDLYSLEMLARVDTICFDKTGTITDGKMNVSKTELIDNTFSLNEKDIISSMLYALKDNNQTAIALSKYFGENKVYDAIETLPFNSARKLSAVSFSDLETFSFGAPEYVLSKTKYKLVQSKIEEYAKRGLRVLVLAKSSKMIKNDTLPTDFSPISLIIIEDNIRQEAISTIQWFKDNGVAIKVISGDNPITVSEVSKRVGIENAERYISLEGLSDEEVAKSANEYTVFGRVSPEQKAILVKALKDAGHTTAMTGDGVNDILALKQADCAITVASGSDAARNISNLVLMDDNFNSLPKVVYEGRRVINNVSSSSSLFLMKTLFTMVLSIITLCLPYMKTYPFLNEHMMLLEVFIIGLPAFFLSFQANDSRVEGKFISHVLKKCLPSALIMIFNVLVIEILKKTLGGDNNVFITMQVLSLTYAGVVSLAFICFPFNKYRTILFFGNVFFIVLITVLSVLNGMQALSLVKLMPLSEYWSNLLIVLGLIIIDIPLLYGLTKLGNKIFFKEKKAVK